MGRRGYRFGVINLTSVPGEQPDAGLPGFRWLGSIDPGTGAVRTRFAGRDSTVQEAIFVPPPGVDTANGDGYVLQLVDRHGIARLYAGRFRSRFTEGHNGPQHGRLLDHPMFQDIVHVEPDRRPAYAR